MGNIDRADWHYGGDYPAGLPPENGGTHIGIYLAWIIDRELDSPDLKEVVGPLYQQVRDRLITGRQLLFSGLDEKFFADLLSEEGLAFTSAYYETNDYFGDYEQTLGGTLETLYHVADTWENYDTMARVLDHRLEAWRRATSPERSL